MTIAETTPLDQAREPLAAKREQIAQMEDDLRRLQSERERLAVAGEDTRSTRAAIAEAEADVDEARMQEAALARTLEQEEQAQRHREQQAALAEVYRRDVEYLKAQKAVAGKRAELERARDDITRLTSDWYDPQLEGRGHPNHDLHGDRVREAPVKLAPLRTRQPSPGPGRAPAKNDIEVDIQRLESVAQEAEASGVRTQEENGAGNE